MSAIPALATSAVSTVPMIKSLLSSAKLEATDISVGALFAIAAVMTPSLISILNAPPLL